MNFAHLHIVLNHIPSLGTVVAVGLFILSLVQKNDNLKKLSLELLVIMALLTIPTYMSGNASQRIIQDRTEIPKSLIEMHQNSAMVTLFLMSVTGTLAWLGLWQIRRYSRPVFWNTSAILIFSVLAAVFILRTANMGGDISHPEIRAAGTAPLDENVGWRESIESYTNDHAWVWPASETVHYLGMAVLFGVSLLLNLRILGMMKGISFVALHRLLPLGIFGFVLCVISGMVFFMSNPSLYFTNPGFTAKIALLLPAALGVIYFTVFDKTWELGKDQDASLSAKLVAVSTLSSIVGVMYFGRMLPFISH